MNPAEKKTQYSIRWSTDVVRRLMEKHPRGYHFVLKAYDIQTHHLVLYLANGDELWRHLRDDIKIVDENFRFYQKRLTLDGYYTMLGGKFAKMRHGKCAQRLDSRLFRVMLKEQGSRLEFPDGSEAEVRERPSLPSDPDVDARGRRWRQEQVCFTDGQEP